MPRTEGPGDAHLSGDDDDGMQRGQVGAIGPSQDAVVVVVAARAHLCPRSLAPTSAQRTAGRAKPMGRR